MTDARMTAAAVSPIAPEAAAAYLAHDPAGNVEMLISLYHDTLLTCHGVRRGDTLVGVIVSGRGWIGGPRIGGIEADDDAALDVLLAAFPPDVEQLSVHRAWMLPALTVALSLVAVPRTAHVFLATDHLVVVPLPAVRLFLPDDSATVAASATPWGRDGFVEALAQGFRAWGIIEGGRVVARAMAAYATGWTEEVAAVWTAPRARGRGLATAVVAATAADILTRRPFATYAARTNNAASLRVAEKVGFRRTHESVLYEVARRLPTRPS